MDRQAWTMRDSSAASVIRTLSIDLFYPLEILSAARVDANLVAFIDEQRNHKREPGLDFRGLVGARSGITLDTRLSLRDNRLDECGQLDADRLLEEVHNVDNDVLDEILGPIAKVIPGQSDALVGCGVHAGVDAVGIVQILHLLVLEICALDLLVGTEGLLDDVAGHEVIHLQADKWRALAGLDVRELNDGKRLTVYLKRNTCAQFIGGNQRLTSWHSAVNRGYCTCQQALRQAFTPLTPPQSGALRGEPVPWAAPSMTRTQSLSR